MIHNQLELFFKAISTDARISITHIGVFAALLEYWRQQRFPCPLVFYSRDIMPLAKISSPTTYHRCVRDLHEYGYITYLASYKRNHGSRIYFVLDDEGKGVRDENNCKRGFGQPAHRFA